MRRLSSILAALALSACADKPPPILPPQEPSLCGYYNSYRYSAAAAAVESTDALDKHNANERAFYEKCITNHPKLDPERKGGPR